MQRRVDRALYLEDCEAGGGLKERGETVGALHVRSGRKMDGN